MASLFRLAVSLPPRDDFFVNSIISATWFIFGLNIVVIATIFKRFLISHCAGCDTRCLTSQATHLRVHIRILFFVAIQFSLHQSLFAYTYFLKSISILGALPPATPAHTPPRLAAGHLRKEPPVTAVMELSYSPLSFAFLVFFNLAMVCSLFLVLFRLVGADGVSPPLWILNSVHGCCGLSRKYDS